jgi:uncharacterized protein (TIGR03435 family)
MRRTIPALLLAIGLFAPLLRGQEPATPEVSRLEFDVVSIKRHLDGDRSGGGGGTLRDGTVRMMNNPLIGILGGAYPSESGEYIGLPDWMRTDRYDVILKPPADVALAPRASRARAEQNRVMMRKMFADRMKLVAHDEMREEPIYLLVLARQDGRLGPQLNPRPDCRAEAAAARAGGAPPQPPPRTGPPSESEVMSRCGGFFTAGRILSGGMNMPLLAAQLRGLVGRFVEDRTGLEGFYTIDLRFAPGRPLASVPAASDPADAPEIFTALQEQLGLKLEPARKQLQVVVIDHIERPTEN